jgi:hypothetical protein
LNACCGFKKILQELAGLAHAARNNALLFGARTVQARFTVMEGKTYATKLLQPRLRRNKGNTSLET